MILNALLWAARAEVPEGGVESRFYTHDEISAALAGVEGTARAVVDDRPLRVQIYAGNEAHKWHNWEKTTPAIQALLEKDPRMQVSVSHTIEDLARLSRENTDVVVQNYVNWHDPSVLSAESRNAFVKFLEQGGGLVLVHFANGAWHFSLPMSEAAAWPEYQKIVRRMWNHKGQSGHDAFGRFMVMRPARPSTRMATSGSAVDEVLMGSDLLKLAGSACCYARSNTPASSISMPGGSRRSVPDLRMRVSRLSSVPRR